MFKKKINSLKEDFQTLGLIREETRTSDGQEDLTEAKVVKKKTGAKAKQAARKRKIEYRKKKSEIKRKAKKYRQSAKGKKTIAKHEKVVKRMGGTKKGKYIRTSSIERNANIIEEISRLNKALLGESRPELFSEQELKELRKSIKNTHHLAAVLAKRLAEYIEQCGEDIPHDILTKHFKEAAPSINPKAPSRKNPGINPDKDLSKNRVGEDQPTDMEDEHGISDPKSEAEKNVQKENMDGETPDDLDDDEMDYIGDEDADGDVDDLDDVDNEYDEENDQGEDGTDGPDNDSGDPEHDYIGDDDKDGYQDDVDEPSHVGEDDDEDDLSLDIDGDGDADLDIDIDDDDDDLGAVDDDDDDDFDDDDVSDDFDDDDDDDDEYDEDVMPTVKDFLEEVQDISGKSSKLLSKLDDKTISPGLAKDVLTSLVNYLGGAMELYTDLNKYAAKPDYENKNLTGMPSKVK